MSIGGAGSSPIDSYYAVNPDKMTTKGKVIVDKIQGHADKLVARSTPLKILAEGKGAFEGTLKEALVFDKAHQAATFGATYFLEKLKNSSNLEMSVPKKIALFIGATFGSLATIALGLPTLGLLPLGIGLLSFAIAKKTVNEGKFANKQLKNLAQDELKRMNPELKAETSASINESDKYAILNAINKFEANLPAGLEKSSAYTALQKYKVDLKEKDNRQL